MRRVALSVLLGLLAATAVAEMTGLYTLPGGTDGQLQYNSGDTFQGVSGSAVSGTGVTVGQIKASTGAFGDAPSISTFGANGALTMSAGKGITLSGSGGDVTATEFRGGGSNLTGIPTNAQIASIGVSTAAIQAEVDAVEVSTGQIHSDLDAEESARVALGYAVGASTKATNLVADALGVSTGTNYSEIKSTYAAHVAFTETLSGVTGTAFTDLSNEVDGKVAKAGDSMSGQLTVYSTVTVTGQDASGYSIRASSGLYAPEGTLNIKQINWTGGGISTAPASGGGGASARVPSRQTFLSGSGTYTTPAGVSRICVREMAGGGGGGSSYTGNGSNGGASYFGVVVVSSGIGGPGGNALASGGTGGTGGAGTVTGLWRVPGGGGFNSGNPTAAQVNGFGGNGAFGGGGGQVAAGNVGIAGATNSGGGGSGGHYSGYAGGGGGAGEYAEFCLDTPAGSYPYTVGAGGAGGDYGAPHYAGGSGAAGFVIVDEY